MDANEQMKHRILVLCNERNITAYRISKAANMSASSVGEQLNGNAKISMQVLFAVLDLCHDVSAEWIVRGEGATLRSDAAKVNSDVLTSLREELIMAKDCIALLKDKIDTLSK